MGEYLGDQENCRLPRKLKSLIEVPYVAHMQVHVLSLNMNLIFSPCRVPRPSYPFPYKICDSTWEKGLSRTKNKFPVEVKISNAVIHCQNSFYFSVSILCVSPTFRRALREQKRLLVTERGDLKELL